MAKLKVQQTKFQRFAEAVFYLLFLVPTLFGAFKIISWIYRFQCPPMIFLAGSMHGNIGTASLVVALTSTILFAIYWLEYSIRPLGAFFGRNLHSGDRYKGFRRHAGAWVAMASALTALPFVLATAFSPYCLTPASITYRSWPMSNTQRYVWQDIVAIDTACTRGLRTSYPVFLLIMQNGSFVDLMDSPRNTEAAYPQLVDALKGVDFKFDSTRVDPNCGFPRVDLLEQRP